MIAVSAWTSQSFRNEFPRMTPSGSSWSLVIQPRQCNSLSVNPHLQEKLISFDAGRLFLWEHANAVRKGINTED